jgi:hypothetical protein
VGRTSQLERVATCIPDSHPIFRSMSAPWTAAAIRPGCQTSTSKGALIRPVADDVSTVVRRCGRVPKR